MRSFCRVYGDYEAIRNLIVRKNISRNIEGIVRKICRTYIFDEFYVASLCDELHADWANSFRIRHS